MNCNNAIYLVNYFTFVKSEAYTSYQMRPVHQHGVVLLLILLAVGLEVLVLLYFFSRDLWLWGLLLMFLVAGLSVGWLIWWYKKGSPPSAQVEASKR